MVRFIFCPGTKSHFACERYRGWNMKSRILPPSPYSAAQRKDIVSLFSGPFAAKPSNRAWL